MSSPAKKAPAVKTRRREVRARIFSEKIPSYFKAVLPKLKSIENLELIRDATKKHAAHLEDDNIALELGEPDVDAAVRCLIQQIVRLGDRMPIENARKNLIEEFAVPEQIASALCEAIPKERRLGIQAFQATKTPALRQLVDLRWRVDVHISTSHLKKKMKPSILMQLLFDDGAIKTFECSPDMFHEFRYSVTKLLHEVQRLEVRLNKDKEGKKKKSTKK